MTTKAQTAAMSRLQAADKAEAYGYGYKRRPNGNIIATFGMKGLHPVTSFEIAPDGRVLP